jgi:hypothetical protein
MAPLSEKPLSASKASGKSGPTSCRTARALAKSPVMSMSTVLRSLSKRIFIAAGLSRNRCSTTRSTSSTLRAPLPPIEL